MSSTSTIRAECIGGPIDGQKVAMKGGRLTFKRRGHKHIYELIKRPRGGYKYEYQGGKR